MSDLKNFPKAYVVILNWNGLDDTIECIKSVKNISYPNYGIILVDNGSKDSPVDSIKKICKDIIFIDNKSNLGFAEGNNVGIRVALDNEARYIWLLNNDTIVHRDALTAMIDVGERIPKSGILGSKIYYYDKPDFIWFAGATINWKRAVSYHTGINQKDHPQYGVLNEVDRITGCSMVVKRELCENIGLMDEKLFLYVEEVDWCIRARNAGYKVIYVPDSKVYHKISSSTGEDFSIIYNYYNTRNFLYVIRKNMRFPVREFYLLNAIFHKLNECKGIVKEIIKPAFWMNGKRATIRFSRLRGVIDFVTGRMGKGYFDETL